MLNGSASRRKACFEWLIGDTARKGHNRVLARKRRGGTWGSWLSCGGPERTRISDLYRVKVARPVRVAPSFLRLFKDFANVHQFPRSFCGLTHITPPFPAG